MPAPGGRTAMASGMLLRDVTASVPEIVEAVAGVGAGELILDGEAIALRADGRPFPFQETMRRFGRRRGWLSNLHLAACDPLSGGFVMLGKTFKGMTDALLAWQTEQLLAREIARDDYTVYVRPELVAEIAFNEIQASPRYPGGLALRFARVLRYRPDKTVAQADTIVTVRALHAGQMRHQSDAC